MNEPTKPEFAVWLSQNVENVRNGAGSYQGVRVTGESLVVRYFTCMSFVVFTTRTSSGYLLQGSDAERHSAVTCTLLTLLLGLWGIPFGIIFTPIYLVKNILGGEKCTVNDLIAMMEKPGGFVKTKDDFQKGPIKVLVGALTVFALLMIALETFKMFNPKRNVSHTNQTSTVSPNQHTLPVSSKQAGTLADPEVAQYMKQIEHKLKSNWYPPKSNRSARVVVTFNIDKTGHANKLEIAKSSGVEEMDEAALTAVHKSERYPELPAVLNGVAPIEFTFSYNIVDNQTKRVPESSGKTEDSDR